MGIDNPTGHEEEPRLEIKHLPTPSRNKYPLPQHGGPVFEVSHAKVVAGGPHYFATEADAREYIAPLKGDGNFYGVIDLARNDGWDDKGTSVRYKHIANFEFQIK